MTERHSVDLELTLDPADLPALLRHPQFRAAARRRPQRCSMIWHDTPDGALAGAGRALVERHQDAESKWRLERLMAGPGDLWPPGGVTPVLAVADDMDGLSPRAPAAALPVAAFEGSVRQLTAPDAAVSVRLFDGELRAITAKAPSCRLVLSGSDAGRLAMELAGQMRLAPPSGSLGAEALTLARRPVPDRPLGPPLLGLDLDASSGFAFVVAHLAGVMLHHAGGARDNRGPEPVHQMRVALRRLRSAILLFRRAVACPELDTLSARLKGLGAVLGPARDWDVFTAGTGRKVGEAFPNDAALIALLTAAQRRQVASYAALRRHLDSAAFRETLMSLALIALTRPWQHILLADPEEAAHVAGLQRKQLADFAAHALSRRHARVVAPGPDLGGLDPPALHTIRLQAKRLRYASEFFSPLFPGRDTRRFLRRLSTVQERLGLINDGAVAQSLMAELGGRGPGRHYAVGVVQGFVAGRSGSGRHRLERCWQRFLKLDPFWT